MGPLCERCAQPIAPDDLVTDVCDWPWHKVCLIKNLTEIASRQYRPTRAPQPERPAYETTPSCSVPTFPYGLKRASFPCGRPIVARGYCANHQPYFVEDPFQGFGKKEA